MVSAFAVLLTGCAGGAPGAGDGGLPLDANRRDVGAGPADGSSDGSSGRLRPTFTDVTAVAGLEYLQWAAYSVPDECPDEELLCVSRLLTGGAATADVDGDGWPDLYVTRLDGPDVLFRNRGDGTFEDVTAEAGLDRPLPSNGAAFGDVDDDGDPDLVVTVVGGTRNHLFINQGDGTFVEEAGARGIAVEDGATHSGMSTCFGDYDRDGWPDLYIAQWEPALDPFVPGHSRLFRNQGSIAPGHFEDTTLEAGVIFAESGTFAGEFPFTPVFRDLDDDGWQDLAVVGDFGTTHLFWNEADGTFSDGTGDLGDGVPSDENGMGTTFADFDRDGRTDWFVTSIYDDRFPCMGPACDGWGKSGNRLYRNLGGRRFEDATEAWGVRAGGWGWGTRAADFDHDGWQDLVMTNGYLYEDEAAHIFHDDPMRLWWNTGDGMVEGAAEAGIEETRSGKALLTFDYDRDGDLDLFVTHNQSGPVLYRNDGPTGHWLRVRAPGRGAASGGSNRGGLGARIEVTVRPGDPPMIRELDGGCGYLGTSENVAHFGLGDATSAHEVRVRWPVTGAEEVRADVPADQVLVVAEP